MKPKPNIFLILAIVLGGVFAFLLNQYLTEQKAKESKMQQQMGEMKKQIETMGQKPVTDVVAPTTKEVVYSLLAIPARTQIVESMLTTKQVPVELIPENAIFDKAEAIDRFAIQSLDASEMLTTSKVKGRSEIPSMAYRIAPGKRAVTLGIPGGDPSVSAANFLNDGDYVDLLLTYDRDNQTRTVLQNVKILAFSAGDESSQTAGNRRPSPDSVTFEVTPQEAEGLVAMTGLGRFRMVLRSVNDSEIVKTKGIFRDEVLENPGILQTRSDRALKAYMQAQAEREAAQKEKAQEKQEVPDVQTQ